MFVSTMPARAVTRLPVPLVFMALSVGIFALMAVFAFAPATMPADGDPAAMGSRPVAGEFVALEAGTPVASNDAASDGFRTALACARNPETTGNRDHADQRS